MHHPAINKDPLNDESIAQCYAKDARNMLHEEDELWEPEDVCVPAVPSAADEEHPLETDPGENSANQPGSETVIIFV